MGHLNRDDRARTLIRDQDGLLSTAQAKEAGFTRAQIAARVKKGEWLREANGVLRAADHPVTPRSRIRAAMLSLGEDATLVGRSAAFWWRLTDVAPAEIEIAVDHARQPRPRTGVRLLRRAVPPQDRVVVDGVPVTKKPATVLAAVASLGLLLGARLMDQALQAGVSLEAMWDVHRRTIGRYGAVVALQLLLLAGGGARSEAERTAHRLLRSAGLRGWHADHEIRLPGFGRAVLDVAFVERRVLIEIDGWAYHRDLRAFLRDARRQNALMLDGWVVIRTNWFELREHPDLFVQNAIAALASEARPTTP
ncbi:type IV toxin-antitoxin system AbiEi family antitoxin domain-containing protein [Actinomycetospora sp. CA-084318]|uniref:type IV toxin-antitoxin system AbiEi family antitoxin domain-containing protein n=1 Tax=Actinomycetospora sp. CA-084318 TaxID=3239892 RepID=UPI003D99040B